MTHPLPQDSTKRHIELPLSNLHIMEVGDGPPLIVVPATISELEDWTTMLQFMGQWFHVVFFELPGHGLSSAFNTRFSSHLVGELVEQLADAMGYQRFSLMGFSFGGILAMRTYFRLSKRIDRLVLNAPCVDHRALTLSPRRQKMVGRINKFLDNPGMHRRFCRIANNPTTLPKLVKFLQIIGRLERTIPLQERLSHVRTTTLAVLNAQIAEILTTEFEVNPQKFETPCYFTMSVNDPLLNFDSTLDILERHFSNLTVNRLTYPFHQPPQPFTVDELNRDFHAIMEAFMFPRSQAG